jgi:hypothetical protein
MKNKNNYKKRKYTNKTGIDPFLYPFPFFKEK